MKEPTDLTAVLVAPAEVVDEMARLFIDAHPDHRIVPEFQEIRRRFEFSTQMITDMGTPPTLN